MACCVLFGYPAGRWGVAARCPVREVASGNSWDSDFGLEIPEPLWPGANGPDEPRILSCPAGERRPSEPPAGTRRA